MTGATVSSRFSSYNKKVWSLAFLVALLTVLVYLPALQNGFVNWDDPHYVYENTHIRSIDSTFLKWMFTSFYASSWHPLTWLSHAIDYSIWGLNPMGHHLTSIIFHGLNTFLVVIVVIGLMGCAKKEDSLLFSPEDEKRLWATSVITGVITGLLFGVHPIHVESVAWVSERKDILCAFFFLLTILSYLKYASASLQKRKSLHYAFCLFFFICALMSKPMAVTLPVVLLILDVYPLGRLRIKSAFSKPLPPIKIPPEPPFPKGGMAGFYGRKAFIEKIPFFLLSLASSVVTILASKAGGVMVPFAVHSFGERFLISFRALIFYIFKMLWPIDLSPLYPYPSKISFLTIEYMSILILTLSITVFCIWSWKRQKIWSVAWAYYVVTLLPVLGLIRLGEQAAADRYTYLPSLGILIIVGLGAAQLMGKSVWRKNRLLFRKLSIIVTIMLILVMLSNLTIMQTRIWKDSLTLWNHVLKIYPNDAWMAYYNRGNAFMYLNDYQKAIEDFKKTIEINPYYAKVYYKLGLIYDGHFINYQQAIKNYSKAIELNPKYAIAYNNRGACYATLGDYHKAIEDFDVAINLDKHAYYHYNRGLAYKMLGKYNQAIKDFQTAAQLGNKQAQKYLESIGMNW